MDYKRYQVLTYDGCTYDDRETYSNKRNAEKAARHYCRRDDWKGALVLDIWRMLIVYHTGEYFSVSNAKEA